jgi:hypothetical protein
MPVSKLFDVGQREVKGARFCYCRIYHKFVIVLPWSRGKIEKSFSPKLSDYFIQGVRNSYQTLYF